jgi:hypothetical protein
MAIQTTSQKWNYAYILHITYILQTEVKPRHIDYDFITLSITFKIYTILVDSVVIGLKLSQCESSHGSTTTIALLIIVNLLSVAKSSTILQRRSWVEYDASKTSTL